MDKTLPLLVMDMPIPAQKLLIDRFGNETLPYHNLTHITQMLGGLVKYFQDGLPRYDMKMLRYAIWFHDLVYDPKATDNEERSAEAISSLYLPPVDVAVIHDLIMATKNHKANTYLEEIMVDLDLYILATPADEYNSYAANIRREYGHVPEEMYRNRRVGVLAKLSETVSLTRLSIAMGLAFDELAERARANMAREIRALKSDRLFDLMIAQRT